MFCRLLRAAVRLRALGRLRGWQGSGGLGGGGAGSERRRRGEWRGAEPRAAPGAAAARGSRGQAGKAGPRSPQATILLGFGGALPPPTSSSDAPSSPPPAPAADWRRRRGTEGRRHASPAVKRPGRKEPLGLPGDVPQAAGESDSLEPWGKGLAYPASFLLLLLLFPSPLLHSPFVLPSLSLSSPFPAPPFSLPPSCPSSSDGRGTTTAATAAA